jgi:putative cell wall-binding protein
LTKTYTHPVRRTAAGVLAGALALSGAVAAATPASAAAGFALERVQGNDRYETSAAIARAFGPSSGVILASGEAGRTVDALSANFLAGVQQVPVLLTARDSTPASVRAVLNSLTGNKSITIVGGTAAVSQAQENALRAAGFAVTRLGGADRYATSEQIITAGRASANAIGLVASGTSFPDALAGGPLAYKGKHPVFLVTRDSIPQDTLDAMVAAGTRSVIILGGEAVVGPRVRSAIEARGITVVTRLAGIDRSATSVAIADYVIANQGFTANTFNLASGAEAGGGADALSGAALSGKESRPLLITNTATSADPVVAFATARRATLNTAGRIFGGPAAVSLALEAAIEAAGVGTATNQTLVVTPTAAATLTLANEATGTQAERDADNRTYTVTGLNPQGRYRITLVNTASVTVAANGAVTFRSSADAASGSGFSVDVGEDIADITSVNGAAPLNNGVALDAAARTATGVPSAAGVLTFTIDGTSAGSVTPVVYLDGGQGGTSTTGGTSVRLETSATAAGQSAAPTETFGIGGATVFVNPAAAAGTFSSTAVQSVNRAANQFDAGNLSFVFDANDTFTISGAPVTLAQFAAALSGGDTISGTFATNPALTSTFNLVDSNPGTVTSVAAAAGEGVNRNDISVTVTFPTGQNLDSVVIQRATVTGLNGQGQTTGDVGAFTTVATVTPTAAQLAAGSLVYVDDNVAPGSYRYQAAVANDGQQSAFVADTTNETSATPTGDTTAPTATTTTLVTDGGLAGLLDSGDVFTIVASEALSAPAAGAVIRVQDVVNATTNPTASVADLVCGTTATCVVNATAIPAGAPRNAGAAAGTVLSITITAAPSVITAGSVPGISIPADITNTAGITDVAGNRISLTTGDVQINP